jgi:hypothetical protein
MTRLPEPPLGHRWQAVIGENYVALMLWKEDRVITSMQHKVRKWTREERDDIMHNLDILARDLIQWMDIRDLLDANHIDVQFESKVGRISFSDWHDWGTDEPANAQ